MMSTLAFSHLFKAFLFLLTMEHSCSTLPVPRPMPAKEWIVIPPILHAAIPVDAVTAIESSFPANFLRKAAMISRSRTDFPVPESLRSSVVEREVKHQRHTSTSCEEDILPLL